MGADLAQQPLGDDALHRPGDEVGLHADIQKAVDGADGVVGVDGGEHQVAGHGGPHGNLGGLTVPDFAHGDDIRVLAEDGAEDVGEGQAGLVVDLDLTDAADVVLHRVLQRDQVDLLAFQAVDHGVEGGGFAGARGAHHEDDALGGVVHQPAEPLPVSALQADALQGGQLRGLPQEADDHLLAVDGGQGGNPEVQGLLADGDVGPSVLGNQLLGNVHPGHDLQAGDHGALELPGHRDDGPEGPVDAHADGHAVLAGLHVDVRGPLGAGPVNDGVHQPDGRGGVRLILVHGHALGLGQGGGAVLAAQQVPLHVLDGLHGPLVAVEVLDRPLHGGGGGDDGHHPAAGHRPDLLHGHEVQRVRHGKPDLGPGGLDGDHHMLLCQAFGQELGHFRRDGAGVQVDELYAQLAHQRVDELPLRDEAVLLQDRAQALSCALLERQRLIQLRLGDVPALDQQVAEFDVFHGVPSFFGGFRQRMTTPSSGVWALMPLPFQLTFRLTVKQAETSS